MEVAQKPTFYSNSDFFIVTLPNRSVATPAQISMESVASGAESAETSAESAETSTVLHGMSTDAEVSELCERLNGTRLTASTKERTLELFRCARWQKWTAKPPCVGVFRVHQREIAEDRICPESHPLH